MHRIGSVSDEDLVRAVLGTTEAGIAGTLISTCGGLGNLSRATTTELELIAGMGPARARRLAAAFELARRAIDTVSQRKTIYTAEDVYRVLAPRFVGVSQEIFVSIGLDARNRVLDVVEVARGTLTGVEVHPREAFRPLIRMGAAAAIVAHNHPSGDPTPSREDRELTRRLRDVGELLGIPLLDHVIVGEKSFRTVNCAPASSSCICERQ